MSRNEVLLCKSILILASSALWTSTSFYAVVGMQGGNIKVQPSDTTYSVDHVLQSRSLKRADSLRFYVKVVCLILLKSDT